ncbi:MAG TPA: hypothetical protein VMF89_23335, partial [Polyangiales bacterium]|nr:hypothetical protein [Polyangiales bacterium]
MRRFPTSRWLLIALPLSGCDGCREKKPYTPFGVTSALPHASVVAPSPSASAETKPDAGATAVRKAALAPDNAKQWELAGMALAAPAGRVFEQALVADFDANGAEDVVSWTLPEPGAPADAAPGELWLYPAGADARRLLEYPSFLPTGSTCPSVAALFASTKSSVTLDVRVSCSTRLVGRAATRALVVVEPFAATPLRFGVRAADPAPEEVLTLDLVPHDEDADGRNDFGLRVGVGSKAAPAEVFAVFQFLDRAAGVSRDATQPSRSLLESLKKDMSRSLKKKTADAALLHVEQTRRLLGSACAEGATARVFDWSGTPLTCAPLQDVVDRLAAVEVSAELARGEVGR